MTNKKRTMDSLDQEVGAPIKDWKNAKFPPLTPIEGRYCRIEPANARRHSAGLFSAFSEDISNQIWTYLPYGPFAKEADFRVWMEGCVLEKEPVFYTIVPKQSGKPSGLASYLRVKPDMGTIEVGHINYAPCLQKTVAATEAMFLLMQRAFNELGYRRYEWKCDALNKASRRAAKRFGFKFEGLFRQASIYKGRNRDTAWYSIIDQDWPDVEAVFLKWLSPENFDDSGKQKISLSATWGKHLPEDDINLSIL